MAAAWNFRGQNLRINRISSNTFGSIFGPPAALAAAPSYDPNSEEPRTITLESAPFTEADIGPILDILRRCPEEIALSRVFRQHHELGTCWFDSLLMMVFENSDIKPFILPFVEVALQSYLANDIHDLGYSTSIEKTPENIEREKMFLGKNAVIDPIRIKYDHKTQLLGTLFKRITGSPIDLYQWNFFAYIIQKYILLAYLFIKGGPVEPRLQKRRGSFNANAHNVIHRDLRCVLGASYCGLEDYSIERVMIPFSQLLEFITRGTFTIVPFEAKEPTVLVRGPRAPEIPNLWMNRIGIEQSEGYYIVLKRRDNYNFGHVISLYKCGGQWALFNNEAETVPLGADSSARLSAVGIKGFTYSIRKNEVQYEITYGDDTIETRVTPLEVEQCRESQYIFSPGASYKLVRLAGAGGRRRRGTRKQRRHGTRRVRKQKV